MNLVRDVYGSVFEGGSVILMGRIAYADGSLVEPDDISSVAYRIEQTDPCAGGSAIAIAGHDNVPIAASSILNETLQTDAAWGEDEIGYNFRHEIDVSVAPAFPEANRSYLVRYELTPFGGQPIIVRFRLEAI